MPFKPTITIYEPLSDREAIFHVRYMLNPSQKNGKLAISFQQIGRFKAMGIDELNVSRY